MNLYTVLKLLKKLDYLSKMLIKLAQHTSESKYVEQQNQHIHHAQKGYFGT